jgi:hypothetical protein
VAGVTSSADLRVHPSNCFQNRLAFAPDAFLAWIVPAGSGPGDLRYATFWGGGIGEDNILALACETSGLVTFCGYSAAGAVPVTPRCLQDAGGPNQTFGFVARLQLAGRGALDLVYASLACPPHAGTNTMLTGLALDELGDVWLAGSTGSNLYHAVNPYQSYAGARDSVLTSLPLLPGPAGCVGRRDLGLSTACTPPPARLYSGMARAPLPGTTFGLTASNAPPGAPGVLVWGLPAQVAVFNAWLLVNPPLLDLTTSADAQGFARLDLPIPSGLPPVPCWTLSTQWLFLTNAACPGTGPLAASERLDF